MKSPISNIPDRLVGGLIALCLLALTVTAAQAADITSKALKDGIYLFQGAGSNVVAVADGDKLLVIDGGRKENSADLMAAIRETTGGSQIATLIDTHWHPDQVGLNDQAGNDKATIIAHEMTAIYLSNRMNSPLFEGWVAPLAANARPNKVTRTGGELTFGGHKVVYGYLPAAHTNGDLYVYFPDDNILVAGGTVGSNSWPLVDYWNGAWFGGTVQAQEKLTTIANDATIVVPADGPTITGAELVKERDMFRQLFRDFHYLMNKGMGHDDAVMLNPVKAYVKQYGDPSAFIEGAYRSMEMANVPD